MESPSRAVVHLDRLRGNASRLRDHVGGRPVLAAIKADGYGHGAVRVARALADIVDAYGIATVGEALELRAAGIGHELLKLSHVLSRDGAQACVDADVVMACVGIENARLLDSVEGGARVHLKVDTGMRRIGVEPDAAVALARMCEELPGIRVEGIFTHLPVGDDPAQNSFTSHQIQRFAQVAHEVEMALGRPLVKHMAHSGGVLAHEDSWFDMVRPGIALYGYYPDAATPRTVPLEPVLEWLSEVSFVKQIAAGESVGYGRTYVAPHPTTVATVPVGYADGYPRLVSNRGHVVVGGRRARVIGRVCMDQLMVEAPGARVGDEVVLVGEGVSAADVAGWAQTLAYEVLCGIGRRVPRV